MRDCQESHKYTKLHNGHVYAESPSQSHAGCLVFWFKLWVPMSQASNFCGFFSNGPEPLPRLIPPPSLQQDSPCLAQCWPWVSEPVSISHWIKIFWWQLGYSPIRSQGMASSGYVYTITKSLSGDHASRDSFSCNRFLLNPEKPPFAVTCLRTLPHHLPPHPDPSSSHARPLQVHEGYPLFPFLREIH